MGYELMPCLWFKSEALEAARFYEKAIPGSRITQIVEGAPGAPPVSVVFEVDGKPFLGLNGNPEHRPDNSVSFVLNCNMQAEIDQLWDALLADGGREMMCGWLIDRFGVRWQVAPRRFPEWLGSGTAEQRQRAMQAMMKMVKIDIAAMEAAHAA
ncbi:VOC family protein [Sandaracinobacteroides hominis]|uniref:VOC family protein n=1 Tax=Sandaracinobacteroides hominis TaxID=2780086 RepID=UPI0018F2C77F|nr:VOC family protein [Sandaracinobacteroides hominis]